MAKKKETTSAPEPEPKAEETPPETPPEAEVKTEETVPEPEEAVAKEAATFEEFLKDDDDDLDEAVAAVAPEKKEPEPKAPEKETKPEEEVPPVVAEAPPAEPKLEAEPPAPAPAAPAPEQPPPEAPAVAPAAAPEPAPAVAPVASMEEIREQYRKNRSEMEANIAATVYNLSDEQVQKLDDGDATIIPEIAARVYMDAVTGAVAHMITHLPSMMESVLAGRDAHEVYEDQFYSAWPNLDRVQHGEVVDRFAAAYRQVNPNVSAEEVIRDVGAQVMVALKVPFAGNSGEPPAAVPLAAPVTPPFQPAKSGGGGTAPGPTNPFDALTEDMETEDLDLG